MFGALIWAGELLQSALGNSTVQFLLTPKSLRVVILTLIFAVGGSYFTQYDSLSFSRGRFRGLIVSLLPLSLTLGVLLSFYHFPNFSFFFKMFALVVVGFLYYIISLVNNIFLVVDEKADVFPLYRVAVTWSQILLVIVSIPVYVGIYKLHYAPIGQAIWATIPSFIFAGYYLWNLSFDKRVRRLSLLEKGINSLFCVFLVALSGLAVSFIPTEPFLRGLFSASVLLFGLNYLEGYLKNRLNKGFLYIYGGIFLIFLILILVFRP